MLAWAKYRSASRAPGITRHHGPLRGARRADSRPSRGVARLDPPASRRVTIPASFDRAALPYWDARAPRWNIAPPLAPGAQDVRFYEECAARVRDSARALDALLLGVTAPIAAMRWPAPTRLVALDWSE